MDRIFTEDELKELGTLTIDKLKKGIDNDADHEELKALADKMYSQFAFLHDGYMCWIASLLTWIYERHGADGVYEAELFAHDIEGKVAWPQMQGGAAPMTIKENVQAHCDALMGHVFQPITVTEDDEKITVTVSPCGSGGRIIEKGGYEKGMATVKEKHPINWGLGDMPIYCCHCPAIEMLGLDNGGDFRWVHPTGDSGKCIGPDCSYLLYKDPKKIPQEYYDRIKRKQPEQ